MEHQPYSSTEFSHIDLIEDDCTRARERSARRHNQQVVDRSRAHMRAHDAKIVAVGVLVVVVGLIVFNVILGGSWPR